MGNITVGLVVAPKLPNKLAHKLKDDLQEDLQENFTSPSNWEIEIEVNRITGSAETVKEIMNETKHLKQIRKWDYAISITDLPIFHGRSIVIADAAKEKKVGQISLPAYGMTPTAKKMRFTLLHLIKELYYRTIRPEKDIYFIEKGIGVTNKPHKKGFFGKLFNAFRFSTIRRVEKPESHEDISVRFIINQKWGVLPTILSGMTIANQPWTIMPSFKKVVGLAFATGSYMLIFTTLWQLSNLYDWTRFVLLMGFAIGGMTAWIIFAHNLWEEKNSSSSNGLRYIYNASTVITLLTAIIIFYLSLFVLFLFAVNIFVPPDVFQETIDQEVGPIQYLKLAWLVTSAATVAGAIGAGLEKEDNVRTSTYSYRQYIRSKEVEKQKEEE